MYAGHFAAGLAIKAAEPRAPMAVLLGLVFLPDLLWLGFSVGGLEVVEPGRWFDGWSHSVASIVLQAAIVAMLWRRQGVGITVALTCAVLSHLVLDLPTHPAPLEWYPHAAAGVGNFLTKTNGWWLETVIVFCGLSIYFVGSRRAGIDKATAGAAVILVAWLHVAFG
jgi:hypothetical protein